jgi:hypothetical protein
LLLRIEFVWEIDFHFLKCFDRFRHSSGITPKAKKNGPSGVIGNGLHCTILNFAIDDNQKIPAEFPYGRRSVFVTQDERSSFSRPLVTYKWIKVVGGVFADALFRLPFYSARGLIFIYLFPESRKKKKTDEHLSERMAHAHRERESDRLCWGKPSVNSIAPNSSLTLIRAMLSICCAAAFFTWDSSILLLPVL